MRNTNFTVTSGRVATRDHNFKIMPKNVDLIHASTPFQIGCVNRWNSLSSDVVNSSSSVDIFMAKLKNCDLGKFLMGQTI